MRYKLTSLLSTRNFTLVSFGALCIIGSFLIGIRSAGDVQTFGRSEAQQADLLHTSDPTGDVDGNGTVDISDAIAVLEVATGVQGVSLDMLRGDTDSDGMLTAKDALWILRSIVQH